MKVENRSKAMPFFATSQNLFGRKKASNLTHFSVLVTHSFWKADVSENLPKYKFNGRYFHICTVTHTAGWGK